MGIGSTFSRLNQLRELSRPTATGSTPRTEDSRAARRRGVGDGDLAQSIRERERVRAVQNARLRARRAENARLGIPDANDEVLQGLLGDFEDTNRDVVDLRRFERGPGPTREERQASREALQAQVPGIRASMQRDAQGRLDRTQGEIGGLRTSAGADSLRRRFGLESDMLDGRFAPTIDDLSRRAGGVMAEDEMRFRLGPRESNRLDGLRARERGQARELDDLVGADTEIDFAEMGEPSDPRLSDALRERLLRERRARGLVGQANDEDLNDAEAALGLRPGERDLAGLDQRGRLATERGTVAEAEFENMADDATRDSRFRRRVAEEDAGRFTAERGASLAAAGAGDRMIDANTRAMEAEAEREALMAESGQSEAERDLGRRGARLTEPGGIESVRVAEDSAIALGSLISEGNPGQVPINVAAEQFPAHVTAIESASRTLAEAFANGSPEEREIAATRAQAILDSLGPQLPEGGYAAVQRGYMLNASSGDRATARVAIRRLNEAVSALNQIATATTLDSAPARVSRGSFIPGPVGAYNAISSATRGERIR